MEDGLIRRRRSFDKIELTAEDILEAIEELSNEEKQKLLYELFYKYYNNRNIPRVEIEWDE